LLTSLLAALFAGFAIGAAFGAVGTTFHAFFGIGSRSGNGGSESKGQNAQ